MKVLVACEESQRVCSAFRAKGHEAYSCDVVDCSGGFPEWHIKFDVNSTDLMYYACYNECNGQLALIGSLVNKVGE